MNLHFLGTTGYHPNDRRHTSCIMIPEVGVVLDAGTGIFRARDLIATEWLQIFLSHAHLDHCVGLTYFLDILNGKPMERLELFGEPAKLDAIRTQLFSEHLFPVIPPFSWKPLNDQRVALAREGQLTWFPLSHPGGAIGYRLDWPEFSLAYVTDTTATPDAAYLPSIQGVDLLIHECNFADGQEELAERTGHSCLTPVAELSRQAQVGRTYLTHFNAMDEREQPVDLARGRQVFESLSIAQDGMVVKLQRP